MKNTLRKTFLFITLATLAGCCNRQEKICCERIAEQYRPVIYFEHNRSVLDAHDKHVLQQIPEHIKHCADLKIHITGYTDNTGTADYNKTLGLLRAQTAQMYLQELGIHADRIQVVSKGEQDPAGNNKTEDGRKLNRRAVVTFSQLQ